MSIELCLMFDNTIKYLLAIILGIDSIHKLDIHIVILHLHCLLNVNFNRSISFICVLLFVNTNSLYIHVDAKIMEFNSFLFKKERKNCLKKEQKNHLFLLIFILLFECFLINNSAYILLKTIVFAKWFLKLWLPSRKTSSIFFVC